MSDDRGRHEPDALLVGSAIRRVYPLPRTSVFGGRAERVAARRRRRGGPGGRQPGHRRRVGLGQVDARAHPARARPGDVGRRSATAASRSCRAGRGRCAGSGARRRSSCRTRSARSIPRMTLASVIREPLVCLDVPGDHDARIVEVLDAVGLDPAWRHPVPARALGRPAAAHRHRPGHRARTDAARRRRAGQRARRVRARADPRPPAPPRRRVRAEPRPRVPRPRRRPATCATT